MALEEIIQIFKEESRHLAWPGEDLEKESFVTRRSSSLSEMNYITAYCLSSETVESTIKREIEHFKNLNQAFEWKVFSFDQPKDLLSKLSSAGFSIGDKEALAFFDLSQGLGHFQQEFQNEVRLVVDDLGLKDYKEVAELVFGNDHSGTMMQLKMALETDDSSHQAFVAYDADLPVSTGRLYTHPESQFAGLYGGGTIPSHRGKGFYRAIVRARADVAHSKGAKYLQVDALPTSLPILLKMGFEHLADTWPACFSLQMPSA